MIELTLPSMTCSHCVRTVSETVRQVDAEARVEVDLEQHRVTIESKQPVAGFSAALAAQGYPPA